MTIKPKIYVQPPIRLKVGVEAPIELYATQRGLAVGPRGHTPYIGENGNWWIDGEDTGHPATGEGGDGLFMLDGEDKVKPIGDRKIDMQHLTGALDPGQFV